ncbi:MAG: hypothetical protein U0O22_09360 [Acutalibacteraceae bacterium]
MTLTGNKLTPSKGMYLKYKDGTVFQGTIYIPNSLTEADFIEITEEEYKNLTTGDKEVTQQEYNALMKKLNALEETTNSNTEQITQVQEALCEVYEAII